MVLQFVFHIILILCFMHTSASALIAQRGCNSSCGDVDILYPFGMNDPKCYAGTWFEIECRNTSDHGRIPYLKSIGVNVTEINVQDATISILNPIYHWNCKFKDAQQAVDLRGSPFVYSRLNNKFVAVGCNKMAFLMSNGTQVSGCVSICDDNENVDTNDLVFDSCNGKSCCETSLPLYLSEYNVTTQNLSNNHASDQCNYALIVAEDYYAPRSKYYYGPQYEYYYGRPKFPDFRDSKHAIAVLEWEILLNSTINLPDNCEMTNVTSPKHGHSGRRCYCDYGYDGNPYIDGGCIMMRDPDFYFHHDRSRAKWAIVGVFSSIGSIILLIASWKLQKVLRKRIAKKRKDKHFKQNGGLLLEQRLASGQVNVEKVKLFSLKDLEKATDRFNTNRVLGKGGQGTVYKGMLVDGKIIAVKKFKVQGKVEEFINEFVVLSQINHRNVVRLLGCCLETKIPLLVYEFIPNGNLFEYLHEHNEDLPMTWEMRLRIATEVAGALFYLHSAASQPIYHRDIKSTNILLDGKYRAKVADFGSSRMISIEDTHLTTVVQGTFGYLDPEYFHTSQFTEKSDVYSFGVVLVELLTGQKPISSLRPEEAKSLASYFVLCMEENRLFDIIDERVTNEGQKEHIIAVANLAYRCLELNGKKRPNMKEVTNELDGIWKLERKFNPEQNNEEIEVAAIEDYQSWATYSASGTGPSPSNRTSTLEVMPILIK